ncbi:hypothetical protein AA0119_g12468 [Alternaria tenuissima]|nr:hypothetical protein AA0119_g12468 [Alternaria tenuissima]RYO04361.1 hypothetical protein AA0121_g12832 [Alternaria tenuissima]
MWPLQDDSCLTTDATSYVDDYLQAIESELFCDSTLRCFDAPYPDLYGVTVDWEPMLQRQHAPATQTEQMDISPYSYTAYTVAADELCFSVAKTGSKRSQTPCSSPPYLCTDEKVCLANDDLSKTAATSFPWGCTREPRFVTPDDLAVLPDLASEDFIDQAVDEREAWVSPEDLVLRGGREPRSAQARQKHERDVLRRYSRAEHEIAFLSRRTRHSTMNTTRRKGGAVGKQAGVKRQERRSR